MLAPACGGGPWLPDGHRHERRWQIVAGQGRRAADPHAPAGRRARDRVAPRDLQAGCRRARARWPALRRHWWTSMRCRSLPTKQRRSRRCSAIRRRSRVAIKRALERATKKAREASPDPDPDGNVRLVVVCDQFEAIFDETVTPAERVGVLRSASHHDPDRRRLGHCHVACRLLQPLRRTAGTLSRPVHRAGRHLCRRRSASGRDFPDDPPPGDDGGHHVRAARRS